MHHVGPSFLRRLRTAAAFVMAGVTAGVSWSAHAEPVRIAVGIDPGFVSFYTARQQKLFEKLGVDVVLTQFTQGGDAMDSVVAGISDMSASAEPTVMIRMARSDMRAIAITAQSSLYLKLVAKSGIADIHGIKKYGMVPGGVFEYLTLKAMRKENIAEDSVTILRAGPPELPALLLRGDIDGFWLFEPFPTMAARQGAKILMNSGDAGYTYTFWVAAKGSWIQSHQDAAHKVMAALAEACALVNKDPQIGADATQAEVKIPAAQMLDFLKQIQCTVRDFSPSDFPTFDDIADTLASRKITPKRVDYRSALDIGFYKP